MMIRLSVALCLLWALLSAGIVGMSRNAGAVGLEVCGGVPCYQAGEISIVPGLTPWSDAHLLLPKVNGSYEKRIVLHGVAQSEISLYPSINGFTVGRIYIDLPAGSYLPAGLIVARYGAPCGLSFYYDQKLLTLRYPFLLVNVQSTGKRLDLAMPVSNVQYSDPAYHSKEQPDLCIDNITTWNMSNQRWQGFTAIARYVRHP
jgi:hypothetical protein